VELSWEENANGVPISVRVGQVGPILHYEGELAWSSYSYGLWALCYPSCKDCRIDGRLKELRLMIGRRFWRERRLLICEFCVLSYMATTFISSLVQRQTYSYSRWPYSTRDQHIVPRRGGELKKSPTLQTGRRHPSWRYQPLSLVGMWQSATIALQEVGSMLTRSAIECQQTKEGDGCASYQARLASRLRRRGREGRSLHAVARGARLRV
jgi:hypothetical protein